MHAELLLHGGTAGREGSAAEAGKDEDLEGGEEKAEGAEAAGGGKWEALEEVGDGGVQGEVRWG